MAANTLELWPSRIERYEVAWMTLHKMRIAMVNPQLTERGSGGRLVLRRRATSDGVVRYTNRVQGTLPWSTSRSAERAAVAFAANHRGLVRGPCIRSLLANVVMEDRRGRADARRPTVNPKNYLDGRSGASRSDQRPNLAKTRSPTVETAGTGYRLTFDKAVTHYA